MSQDHFQHYLKMVKSLSILIACLVSASACAADDATILKAIACVESGMDYSARGDRGASLGAWQMQLSSWIEANSYRRRHGLPAISYSAWRSSDVQRQMASAFLQVIRLRYKSVGIHDPSPAQIAVVWNKGWTSAKSSGFRLNDYAKRVNNLCH